MPAAFRLYPQFFTFFSDDTTPVPGGSLRFFVAGTSTPKDVFGEKALTTNNGSVITLDAGSRPEHPIWGSGQYDVHLYDVDNVKVGEDLTVEIPGGEATALPALDSDKFLTNDGSVMSWADVLQVPDPTGAANKILGTDGTAVSWIAKPADGAAGASADIDVLSDGLRLGDTGTPTTSWRVLRGTGTITASGAHTASGSATFGVTFLSAPTVIVQATGGGVTGGGYHPIPSVTSVSTTGFNVAVNTNESSDSGANISSTVNYSYIAIGTMTTP